VLKRSGTVAKMNPYDLFALETALRLKESNKAFISVISMGPPQADSVIREAYMMGADKGYLMTDKRFAGSDVLATSYALAGGIKKTGNFDLVICGKQTTDGDTAQVGPAIAEHLGIPHAAWVNSIAIEDHKVIAEQNMENSVEKVSLPCPCLITVEKDINTPRLPSYKKKIATADRPVINICLDDLDDTDETHYGLKGSPTQVERIFEPEDNTKKEKWCEDNTILADKLFRLLKDEKYI
jgi:electron transfer flavoprotein beta subunit